MGFFDNLMKNAAKNAASDLSATFAIGKQVENKVKNGAANLGRIFGDIGTGIKNWWYSQTGRSYLTDDYQHEEQLANTSYQRAVEDMEKAGLSKFYGVSGASSPSTNPGSGLLSTALALQQLKAGKVAIDEQSWNLDKAKDWGVPTTAVDQFAKWDALAKLLFGGSVDDITDGGGLITKLYNLITGGSPVSGSAATDAAQSVLSTEANGFTPQPRSSSDASGPYAEVFDQFSHNINTFVKGNYGKYVPKDVTITHDHIRDVMKGALNSLMVDYDLPFDSAAKIVNSWTLKMLGNWQGIVYDLFITGSEIPSSVPSSTSVPGGGFGGGGGFTW